MKSYVLLSRASDAKTKVFERSARRYVAFDKRAARLTPDVGEAVKFPTVKAARALLPLYAEALNGQTLTILEINE